MVRNTPAPPGSGFIPRSRHKVLLSNASFAGTPMACIMEYSGPGRLDFKNKHTTWVSAYSPSTDVDRGYIRLTGTTRLFLGYLQARYPGFTFTRVISTKKFNQGCYQLFCCTEYVITISGKHPPPPCAKYVAKSMFLDWDNHPAKLIGVSYNEFYRCDHGRRKAKEYLINLAAKALTPTLTAIYGKDIFDSTEEVENEMKEKKEKEEGHVM